MSSRRLRAVFVKELHHITRMGGSIAWADRAERLYTAAHLALAEFEGDFLRAFNLEN